VNDSINELKKKCWDNQIERLDVEKFAQLILEDVMSICEDLGDKGMDGHYCVDAIRNKFGLWPGVLDKNEGMPPEKEGGALHNALHQAMYLLGKWEEGFSVEDFYHDLAALEEDIAEVLNKPVKN